MKTTLAMAILATFALATIVPVATAQGTPVLIPCTHTGYQGTITTVLTGAHTSGTGWNPYPKYYVYGSYTYTNIDAYNYCIAGNQVGAVALGAQTTRSWASCVTCASDVIGSSTLLLA
jgi:hypothetical protein